MPELSYRETTLNGADVMVAFYGPNREYAFVWSGGAYIDVCFESSMGSVKLDGTFYEYGCQCISVYDYSDGSTIIDWRDKKAFIAKIKKWFRQESPVRTW